MKDITPPIIHLNGTSGPRLLEDYNTASTAFYRFIDEWGRIAFNARDYYPKGAEYFEAALENREEISRKIEEIREYLTAHQISISDQVEARKQ